MLTLDDVSVELRRITILERNAEYYDAAQKCFKLFRRTKTSDVAIRGFNNLWASSWHANSLAEMRATLSEFFSQLKSIEESLLLNPKQLAYLNALSWEAEGWLSDPPNHENLLQAITSFVEANDIPRALTLLESTVAFLEPDQQVSRIRYGLELADQLTAEAKDVYYLLLIEPLLLYETEDQKQALLREILTRIQTLVGTPNRSANGNIAVLRGVDLLHPYRIEFDLIRQIRHDNVHELVRSLVDVTDNQTRGKMLALLGSSYYRMAEDEQDPELRQDLYEKAKDHFLQSVSTFEKTPAYGELLYAYTLAGTGFLSIAELEQDFKRRNELYKLGEELLRKARRIGEMTHQYQLRARAAINLGVALERLTWFDLNPESRKDRLMEIFNLQLEGKGLAEKTKSLRGAGYATMNASEMCGFLSDLETRTDKKREWAFQQRELSQKGLELLNQTQDLRGQIVALSYAAFACAKLAELSPAFSEKQPLYEEMLQYGEQATKLKEKVPDPVATAYAFQQAGDAAKHLGILLGERQLLEKAGLFYKQASDDWAKTGERHKRAQALTHHADLLLFQSSLDFTPEEAIRFKLLEESEQLHREAAELNSNLFFYHDKGENHWRIGQIHLLRGDFISAQEYFNKVQQAFDQAAELIPDLADVYSVFSTFGITLVGLVDGLGIIERGDYAHAALLFDDLTKELQTETERSLRQLRQLLVALTHICRYATSGDANQREDAQSELARLLNQLPSDAYEQQLPYSLHKTIHRLQIFLTAPKLYFPPLLLELPLHEKMITMVQARHMVNTALSMYQATATQRDVPTEEPTEDIIRTYVARISDILEDR